MNERIQRIRALVRKRGQIEIRRVTTILLTLFVLFMPIATYAHSGRTDSSGGHNDNKNKSGLGSYHYHHGSGPHLHPDGVCPYSVKPKSSSSSNTNTKYSTSNTTPSLSANELNIQMQNKLNELGYKCGKADGIIGRNTKAAIKDFQKDKGLVVDGIVGSKTLKALGL